MPLSVSKTQTVFLTGFLLVLVVFGGWRGSFKGKRKQNKCVEHFYRSFFAVVSDNGNLLFFV
jgi:hypothetical protein